MPTEIMTQRRIAAMAKLMRGISTEDLEQATNYEQLITTVVDEHKLMLGIIRDLCQGSLAHTSYVGQRLPEPLLIKIFAPNR